MCARSGRTDETDGVQGESGPYGFNVLKEEERT